MQSRLLAAATLALATGGCGSGGSTSSPMPSPTSPTSSAVMVNIMGQRNEQSFSPNPAPIAQGSLVGWQNNDNTTHRIVMNDGSFDSGNIAPGATSTSMRLSSAGGSYHCVLHPTTMWGSIHTADTTAPGTPAGPY